MFPILPRSEFSKINQANILGNTLYSSDDKAGNTVADKAIYSFDDKSINASIDAAQQGDKKALTAICRQYEGLIHKYAHVSAVKCESSEIESHLWEIFIRAVKEYKLDGDIPFSGFVKSRIRYGQYNAFRKLRKQWQQEIFMMNSPTDGEDHTMTFEDILSPSDSTETVALINADKRAVARAFKRLMPEQQKLLYAYYIKGISLAQLAKKYGISRQAMQQHKNRALAALTVFYNDESTK